jgi:site-specific recombinase XerD
MRSRANYAMAVSSLYRMLVMDGMAGFTYSDYLVVHKAVQEATRYNDVPIEKKLPPEEVMSAILDAIQAPPQIDLHLKAQRRWRLHMVWLRNRALILGLYSTGMRISELLGLRRQDLDYSAQGAWVTGKGDKTRFVRFSRQAWQAIEAYLVERNDNSVGLPSSMPVICRHDRATGDFRRQPMSPVSAERAVTALAKETGVLERFNLTPHSFRHYFATKFLRATGDLALTQDVMGHADPATTRLYAKTSQAQHIKAHQALFDE